MDYFQSNLIIICLLQTEIDFLWLNLIITNLISQCKQPNVPSSHNRSQQYLFAGKYTEISGGTADLGEITSYGTKCNIHCGKKYRNLSLISFQAFPGLYYPLISSIIRREAIDISIHKGIDKTGHKRDVGTLFISVYCNA